MKKEDDVHRVIQDLQDLTIAVPHHRDRLRKRLITAHRMGAGAHRRSLANARLLLPMRPLRIAGASRKLLSLGLVVVSAAILALGFLLLLPSARQQPNQKSIATAAAPVPPAYTAGSSVTCSTPACSADEDAAVPTPPPPSPTPKTTAPHPTPITPLPPPPAPAPSAAPEPSETTAPSAITVGLASPIVSVNVSLPFTDDDPVKPKKDKPKKDKAAKAAK